MRTACSTRATSSASTTCASPRAGCARCSRSSPPASRPPSTSACCATSRSWPTRSASAATPTCTSPRCRPSAACHADARSGVTWLVAEQRERRRRATRCSPPSSSGWRSAACTGACSPLADAAERRRSDEDAVKARRIKGLDPEGPLADNAERIVLVRLDELCGFMPRAADPAEWVALHDMRIAAKRLRYVLEVTGARLRRVREEGDQAGQGPPGPARRDPRLRRPDPRPRPPRSAAGGRRRRRSSRSPATPTTSTRSCSSRLRTSATTPASPRSRPTSAPAAASSSPASWSSGTSWSERGSVHDSNTP